MPYITKLERRELDPVIADAAVTLNGMVTKNLPNNVDSSFVTITSSAGLFNYFVTQLALKTMLRRRSYWVMALVLGVMVTIILEIYRRIVAPYEDDKIKEPERGDVF